MNRRQLLALAAGVPLAGAALTAERRPKHWVEAPFLVDGGKYSSFPDALLALASYARRNGITRPEDVKVVRSSGRRWAVELKADA